MAAAQNDKQIFRVLPVAKQKGFNLLGEFLREIVFVSSN